MAKKFRPHKLIIEFGGDGEFKGGTFLYKVRIDGIWDRRQRSIGVKNIGFSKVRLKQILTAIKEHVRD